MRFTRRKYSSVASGIGVSLLAGCLNPPETDESTSDINNEPSIQDDGPENPLHASLREITEFTQWKATEYESAISSYRNKLRAVETKLDELSTREANTVTQSDLDDLVAEADAATSINDELETYYGTAPNLSKLVQDIEVDLQRNLDRSEFEQLSLELDKYRNTYRAFSTSTDIERRFPSDPVSGKPYEQFISGTNIGEYNDDVDEDDDYIEEYNDYIFEVMMLNDSDENDSDEIEHAFFVTHEHATVSEDPFNYAPDSIVSSDRHIPVDEFGRDLIDRTEHEILFESRLNIIRQSLYEEYPGEYFETSEKVSVSDSESVGVIVQQLEDESAAEDLYDEYIDTGTVDSQVQIGEYTWDRIYFSEESPTVYTHLMSHQEYVICMDVTDIQWENRSFGEDEVSLREAIEGTFVHN